MSVTPSLRHCVTPSLLLKPEDEKVLMRQERVFLRERVACAPELLLDFVSGNARLLGRTDG